MNRVLSPEGMSAVEGDLSQRQVGDVVATHLGDVMLAEYPAAPNFNQLLDAEGRVTWGMARAIGKAALVETKVIAHDERCLTEVDNLLLYRQGPRMYPTDILRSQHVNNRTRTTESAMPHAVSTTVQEFVDGDFWWLRRSGLQVSASGHRFHQHEEALLRVDVEVVNALFTNERLGPDKTSVLLSAQMSPKDASKEVAKHEHLSDDDSIQIQWLGYNSDGSIHGKYVQSILIKSDLREAWVAMLADPNNLFGKSIIVEDPDSALSLMKAFTEMQIDSDKLPEGVVTLLEATIPYIANAEQRKEVMAMLPEYRSNQQRMAQVAEDVACRWDAFDIELAESLATEEATEEIASFIANLGDRWNDEDRKLLARHQLAPGKYKMTRELAKRLEKAQESILCSQAAILVKNKHALKQVDAETVARITADVERLHDLRRSGAIAHQQEILELQRRTTSTTAMQNIKLSGGCPGEVEGRFRRPDGEPSPAEAEQEEEWTQDRKGSRKFICPSCKEENKRPIANQLEPECQHCHKAIPRCGPADKKSAEVAGVASTEVDVKKFGVQIMKLGSGNLVKA